jgi:hypothetical protein
MVFLSFILPFFFPEPPLLLQRFSLLLPGWSEPAATNAPDEDEAVQAVLGMNQKHISPA